MRYHWTKEQEALLAHLCQTTKMSASEIGAKLGRKRNAVIGKVARAGLRLPNAGKGDFGKVAKGRKRAARKPASLNGSPPKMEQVTATPSRPVRQPFNLDKVPLKSPARPDAGCQATFGALIEGPRNRCQFPVDGIGQAAGPDMMCCGADLTPGGKGLARSFCDHHVALSTERACGHAAANSGRRKTLVRA